MPKERPPRSLRSTLLTTAVPAIIVALLASGALIFITTILDDASDDIASSVESVRIAEEAENALLIHSRARDGVVRSKMDRRLRRLLTEAGAHVKYEDELETLEEARERIEKYLLTPRDDPDADAMEELAYAALERLVDINVTEARELHADVHRVNWVSNFAGLIAATLILLLGLLLLVRLRRAFDPVFSIADAIHRFAGGQLDARAAESGPRELRSIASGFNAMAYALRDQRSAQTAFLAGVAHDLRNPLAALKLALTRPGGVQRDVADRQIRRLERMVGDFLDASKVEAGTLEIEMEHCDLRRIVHDVLDQFDDASDRHSIRLRTPDAPLVVECDAMRIEQVLANLLSNAIKYSPGGGDIDVIVDAVDDKARMVVRDCGVGISAQDLAHVFDPFRRLGLSRENVAGVGLGLYVVKKVVQMHGGEVEVESVAGKGTTFRVMLPLAAVDAPLSHVVELR